jgi:glutamate-1-semialdehyde 2,1-aminomutase
MSVFVNHSQRILAVRYGLRAPEKPGPFFAVGHLEFSVHCPGMHTPGPLSQKLFAHAKQHIPGGVNSPVRAFRNVGGEPFFVRKAHGSRIEDVDGKTYIDYIGSWGPNILGHAPVAITNTIHEVAKSGVSFGIPNPFEVEMARTICEWVPSVEKVRMCNSGTEATMSAIRLARGFTKRDLIVKFDGCYHGHSDSLLVAAGSGALTHGEPDSAGVPKSFAANTLVLPYNNPGALEELFAARGGEIAAIIVESYPANAGLVFPKPGYLDLLSSITGKHGALLIFDEVMTGFRLGKAGVQGIENLTPDLSCFGKVIGGGLPVGAFGGRADVMDLLAPLGPVYQAGTLSGNPLAMAAGLAQLKELAKPSGFPRLDQLGAHFESGLRCLLTEKGIPHQINRTGSMFCLFFTDREIVNVDDVMKQDLEFFRKFFWGCLDKGVYLAPSPYETGFISLAHTEADLDDTLTVFAEVLGAI